MKENLLLVLFTISLCLFLFYCISPYLSFYQKFMEEDGDDEDSQKLLKQNPRYRIFQSILKEELSKLKAMNEGQLNSLFTGDKKLVKKKEVQIERACIRVRIELVNCLKESNPKIKMAVMPDKLLGPLFAVGTSWSPASKR